VEAIFDDEQALFDGAMNFASELKKNRWIYGQNKSQMNKHITAAMDHEDPEFIEKMSVILTNLMQKNKM
jgi:hypothetical protein